MRAAEIREAPARLVQLGLGVALAALLGFAAEHLLPGHHVHLSHDHPLHHHHFFLGEHEHPESEPDHDHSRPAPEPDEKPDLSALLTNSPLSLLEPAFELATSLELSEIIACVDAGDLPTLLISHPGDPRGPPV